MRIHCTECKKNIVEIQLPKDEDFQEFSLSEIKIIKASCMECWDKEGPKEIYQFEGQQIEVYYPHGIRAEMITDLTSDVETGIIVVRKRNLMSKFKELREDSWKTIKGLKNIFKKSK